MRLKAREPFGQRLACSGGVEAFAVGFLGFTVEVEWWEQAEVDIHRLISAGIRAAGNMRQQRAQRGRRGRRYQTGIGCKPPRKQRYAEDT